MYSTISKKIGKCRLCPPDSGDKYLIAGLCLYHYKNEQSKRYLERQKLKNKTRQLIKVQDNSAASWQIELNEWYKERGKELTGFCAHCGGRSCKGNKKYERYSICHILEKSKVKSVATHPLNFIELCFFGMSCHTQMDNKMLPMDEMKCWSEIVYRFKQMYPFIAPKEHQYIPDTLLKTLK